MKKLLQTVAVVLALLMLAPPAFAVAECSHKMVEQSCKPSCCDGMSGMAMQMAGAAINSASQDKVSQTACCVETQKNAAVQAALATSASAHSEMLARVASVVLPWVPAHMRPERVEGPPDPGPQTPVQSRLCTFQI